MVGKALDTSGNSVVLGTACSTTSTNDAHTKADALAYKASGADARTNGAQLAASSTLLLNEYQDLNYTGGVIYSYFGSSGGCDSSGYHLVNTWSVEHNVTSMRGYNGCTKVNVNDEYSAHQIFSLPVSYLGDHYNDNVVALQVYNG